MNLRSTETKIVVEDLRIEAHVGQHAPEREQVQTIAVDIVCTLKEPEVMGDEIARTVDYLPIVEQVRDLAIGRKRRLIETLAEEIAEVCLADPNARSVVVSIRKPNKLPGVQAVGITRTFERKE